MAVWEEFEVECTNFLNHQFCAYAKFIHQGGSDSTVPDILVKTKNGRSFYIDVKHSPAQCGQFVLLPDIKTQSFQYSPLNVNRKNKYAELIMEHMNKDFDAFREAGTAGKEINMPNGPTVFAAWIIQVYKEKGAEFFITNGYTILPINRFSDYFEVSAKYRIKRSGSSNVGKSRFNLVKKHIQSLDATITEIHTDGDKLFVTSPQQLHNKRFIFRGNEYMFSLRGDKYELRRLSNTYNANVIFSITQKTATSGITNEEFIRYLK
ncbi:MAG: hypothetical protein Q4D90_07385 [bacterium]|nr:hypothetical protein [bacterium]